MTCTWVNEVQVKKLWIIKSQIRSCANWQL